LAYALDVAVRQAQPAPTDAQGVLRSQLATVTREIEHLTAAITAGGDLTPVVAALKARETQRQTLTRQLAHVASRARLMMDAKRLRADLLQRLEDWRALLGRHVPQARQILKKLLVGPILFTPERDDHGRYYALSATGSLGKLLAGVPGANLVASPTGTGRSWIVERTGFVAA
jgi:hypothetical protein